MPRPAGRENISRSVQRAIALDALGGARTSEVAAEHGVSRQNVERLRDEALKNPDGAFEEARAELEFRREVMEMAE